MPKRVRRVLLTTGIIIAGFSMIVVFNHANIISNQTLTVGETDSQQNMIYLFLNMAIAFSVGGLSLKILLDDMSE